MTPEAPREEPHFMDPLIEAFAEQAKREPGRAIAHDLLEGDRARRALDAIRALCDQADGDLNVDTCHRVWTDDLRAALDTT